MKNDTVSGGLYFVAYYMPLGDIQRVGNKDGLILKDAQIIREKNNLLFYNIDGELGERKISLAAVNVMRDFGTSVYGLFNYEISKKEALELIIEKLEERVLETYKVKGNIINLISDC